MGWGKRDLTRVLLGSPNLYGLGAHFRPFDRESMAVRSCAE